MIRHKISTHSAHSDNFIFSIGCLIELKLFFQTDAEYFLVHYQNKKALFTNPIFSEGFGKNQKCTLDLVTLNSHYTRMASEQDWKPLQISINLLETAVILIGNDVFNSKMHFLSAVFL